MILIQKLNETNLELSNLTTSAATTSSEVSMSSYLEWVPIGLTIAAFIVFGVYLLVAWLRKSENEEKEDKNNVEKGLVLKNENINISGAFENPTTSADCEGSDWNQKN